MVGGACELAAHILCPSASYILLIHGRYVYSRVSDGVIQETFPTTASQNAIVFRYTTPVKMVALEIKTPRDFIACTLVFRFSDATVIRLGIELFGDIDDEGGFYTPWEDMAPIVFSQAHGTVLGHPLLPNVKRLHILNEVYFISGTREPIEIGNEVGRLFKSVGHLEELTLCGCDLCPYLVPFLGLPGSEYMEQLIVFPPIKELMISHPLVEEEWMTAIVELARGTL